MTDPTAPFRREESKHETAALHCCIELIPAFDLHESSRVSSYCDEGTEKDESMH